MNNADRYVACCTAFDAQHDATQDAWNAIEGLDVEDSDPRRKRYVSEVERGRFAFKRYVAAKAALLAERAARSAAQLATMSSIEVKRSIALADRLGAWFAAEDSAVYRWESHSEWRQIRETSDALAAHRAQLDAVLATALDRETYDAARSETLRSLVGRVA